MGSYRTRCGNCTPAAYEAHLKATGGCAKPGPKCTGPTSIKMECSPPSSPPPEDNGLRGWPRQDRRRILHVVYRVGDIEKSMKWYEDCLGMQILRKRDVPDEKYMNVFMGYDYGVTKYDLGAAFGHFGIAVTNVQKALDAIKKKGYKTPAGPTKERNEVCAFLEDPDGYKVKLIQRKNSREPFCQLSYRVADVDRSILFHQDVYGMKLLARKDYPKDKKTFAYVAYDMDETRSTVLEFEYNYGKTDYPKGTGYAQLAIGTEDVYKTAGATELLGGKTVRPPGALPKFNTKIYSNEDLDGWKTVWVDNEDFARELEPASFTHQVKCTTRNDRQHL
ncbi:hypothetical protein M758_10G086100 [Ceratodon purpureus]|nr:hypothetical protein M758_10G086100 [Ceratodon purpureus]KAG0603343.1 hypothetical protein M758_10G086100 [Ceratodon purpureus]